MKITLEHKKKEDKKKKEFMKCYMVACFVAMCTFYLISFVFVFIGKNPLESALNTAIQTLTYVNVSNGIGYSVLNSVRAYAEDKFGYGDTTGSEERKYINTEIGGHENRGN